jgi:hypothetical protein
MFNLAIAVRFLTEEGANSLEGWHRLVTWPEGITTWAIILTLAAIVWQAILTRKAVQVAQASVDASKDAAKRLLRAYLAVTCGTALHQERNMPLRPDLKFEARPKVLNTGQTPAHKVKCFGNAAILTDPLPKEAILASPGGNPPEGTIGAQQDITVQLPVGDFCDDSEVQSVKAGSNGKALYAWGVVTYLDAFGDEHSTRFCQRITWQNPGQIYCEYVDGRNEAN